MANALAGEDAKPNGQVVASDPHARIPIPSWAGIRLIAEPGTRVRFRDYGNGLIDLFIRAPMLAAWPHGTPPLGPGEHEIEIRPPANAFGVSNNQFRYVDHPFTPSPLDESRCTVCADPGRLRWQLEVMRRGAEPKAEPTHELLWFDEKADALAERTRLAADPNVMGVGLQQAMWREAPGD